MKEVVVMLTDNHIKVKNGKYVCDLIRCGECRHWTEDAIEWQYCKTMMPDDFCSYGEENYEEMV